MPTSTTEGPKRKEKKTQKLIYHSLGINSIKDGERISEKVAVLLASVRVFQTCWWVYR